MARPRSLPTVAAHGDRLDTLRALRDRLAREIHQSGSARDVAALSRQLRETLAEVDRLGAKTTITQEDTTFDELSRRRADRGAGAPSRDRSTRREPG
jgi:hypothetical protein